MSTKKVYRFTMPLYLYLSEKPRICRTATKSKAVGDKIPPKKYHLNLNAMVTWHYQTKNNLKLLYTEMAVKFLRGIKMSTPIKLTFVHYYPDLKKRDRANVCCIHEKFFCDALTEAGCIPDDNDKYIIESKYLSGGLDRKNGRVEIIIEEV